MFVAILSSTVVSTALPRIIGDLGGSQSAYTWVVTSTLLALTVITPIWGKLSDLFEGKLLVQTGLVLYVGGSILAGLSQSTGFLIACRVVQGIGVGGLTALVQVILSDVVSPRERGRYAAISARCSGWAPSPVHTIYRRGKPGYEIVKAAEAGDYDAIIPVPAAPGASGR